MVERWYVGRGVSYIVFTSAYTVSYYIVLTFFSIFTTASIVAAAISDNKALRSTRYYYSTRE